MGRGTRRRGSESRSYAIPLLVSADGNSPERFSPPLGRFHYSPCILHHIKRQMDRSHVKGKTDQVKTREGCLLN